MVVMVITYISQSSHTTSCRDGARKLEANSSVLALVLTVVTMVTMVAILMMILMMIMTELAVCLISPGADCRLRS